jgi:AraC family transcriptional regulator, regulatory protein of adaptative response / methylated-DNA-[protein]-cysteine methyltransferase
MDARQTTARQGTSDGLHVAKEARETLAFSLGDTKLGSVLIARSPAGVCSILLGPDEKQLRDDLEDRFPYQRLVRDDSQLAEDIHKVQRFIEEPAVGLALALDVRGSPWQRRVWSALLGVPAGATVTYAALAARLGEPGSARAVARACAANAIALAIPCHRVIRKDGTLSGYRWGVERKRALLAKEAA